MTKNARRNPKRLCVFALATALTLFAAGGASADPIKIGGFDLVTHYTLSDGKLSFGDSAEYGEVTSDDGNIGLLGASVFFEIALTSAPTPALSAVFGGTGVLPSQSRRALIAAQTQGPNGPGSAVGRCAWVEGIQRCVRRL